MKKKVEYFLLVLTLLTPVLLSCRYKSSRSTSWLHVKPLAKKQEKMQFFPKETYIPDMGSQNEITILKNIPFVETYINKQGPFLFAVDTGVSGLMVSDELARKLGLKVSSKKTKVILNTPSGEMNLGRPIDVERLNIGNGVFLHTEAARIPTGTLGKFAIEGIEFDGILGIGLFRDCVFELDYAEKQLKLVTSENSSEIMSEGIVPAAFTDQGIIVKGTVDNKNLSFLLDTGSPYGISLAGEHAAGLKFKNESKTCVLLTLSGRQKVTISTLNGEAVFGNLQFKDPLIYIYTRNILGGEILKNYVLKINQKQQYVSIKKK